jgi:hypothetical protein
MSSRYDRINTAITQIPISSAVKVFSFIEQLFENKLDKEIFKQHFWDFNTGEQHFICYYLDIYFNSSERTSFFNKWLEQKEKIYRDAGELEDFYDFKEELGRNKQQLLDILGSYKRTAERRLKMLIKHKVDFDRYSDFYKQGQIDYRIQLYYKPSDFKTFFIEEMKKVMTQENALNFFINSFEFGTNIHHVRLLYIELDNLTDIKEQMTNVKKRYDEDYKYVLENNLEAYNQKLVSRIALRNLSDAQKEFYEIKQLEAPTLTDFAKIMYNAFPEIRDKAIGKSLNHFLKNYGSNLLHRA